MTAYGRLAAVAAGTDDDPLEAAQVAEATPGEADADWSAQGWVEDVRPALERGRQTDRPCALVTLCGVEGPSPRPLGAQMLIGDEIIGHLSGGCIEADVALHARACIADGAPRRLVYGKGGPWPDIRLACGGRIDLLVERIAPDDVAVAELLQRKHARMPAALASDGLARHVLAPDQAPQAPAGGYVRAYMPATRLVVVGRDPTALAMCDLGLQIGFEVVLVSPQGPQPPPPLKGLRYLREAPAAALQAVGLDPWTAVAVATHDPEWDEAALATALPSAAAYVGALGARSRLADQRARLEAAGVAGEALDRLHAPIGQPGYGKAAWSIAIATIAEILQVKFGETPAVHCSNL